MTPFEVYSLVLCLIVFFMLTAVFTFMLIKIYKMTITIIESGLMDEKILREYKRKKRTFRVFRIVELAVSLTVSIALYVAFAFSLYVNLSDERYFDKVPTLQVVMSSSMEKKNPKNEYLFENGLDNQFSTFDVIRVYKAPGEFELQLYDIVVYEVDGIRVVHRIVGIEEPNEEHPNERYFLTQGDAVERPDNFPIKYSQIKAIYKNERTPFIGSFICFMQSPAGWICIILTVFSMISMFWVEKKIDEEKRIRLEDMGEILPLLEWKH